MAIDPTIGERAAAKGLAVFAGTADRREGFQNDNQRGDELADVIDDLQALDLAKLDKSKLVVQQADPGHLEGRIWVSWV